MEVFLQALLPRLLPEDTTFEIHAFQGKSDLLSKLEDRLRGYERWLPPNWHIVVLVTETTTTATSSRRDCNRWQPNQAC